jgi:hypothetical protein
MNYSSFTNSELFSVKGKVSAKGITADHQVCIVTGAGSGA